MPSSNLLPQSWPSLVLGLLLCVCLPFAADAQSLQRLKEQESLVVQQVANLQQKIQKIQKQIQLQERDKKDVLDELEDTESKISVIQARLSRLNEQKQSAQKDWQDLQRQMDEAEQWIELTQRQLAQMAKAQYQAQLSPWIVLMSGQDTQKIGRDLGYMGYIAKARADKVAQIKIQQKNLRVLSLQSEASKDKINTIAQQTSEEVLRLRREQAKHKKILSQIDQGLKQRRQQVSKLSQDQARLNSLVDQLQAKIGVQRKALRQANLEQQKAKLVQQAELVKLTEQEAQQVKNQAEQDLLFSKQHKSGWLSADENAEIDRAKAKIELERAKQVEQRATQARQDFLRAHQAIKEGQAGLQKGAPWPLRGVIVGQFGMPRPDTTDIWRGLLISAPMGAPVKAIASGQVVYAGWVRGFGNLMIVDHGNGYLSIYGFNQSLLKKVGDSVNVGQTIALVGATGGRVEPGLYFEIRQGTRVINPLSILAK